MDDDTAVEQVQWQDVEKLGSSAVRFVAPKHFLHLEAKSQCQHRLLHGREPGECGSLV